MRQKINKNVLAMAQNYARKKKHPILQQLYRTSYKLVSQVLSPVSRKYSKICIHGNYPELFLPDLTGNLNPNHHINAHSFINFDNPDGQIVVKEGQFVAKKDQYDLIITCLEGHHGQFQEIIKKYMSSLEPDGALIGCTWTENTLKQLRWAYMMAENQRYGGVSPKVYGFPSFAQIGHVMQMQNVQIPTILVKDFEIEVESVVDILTILQLMGESGYLHGRRKAAYPDLLMAMSALYDSQFKTEEDRVRFSLQLGLFIGWKYHESQKQSLPRQKVENTAFFDELKKFDPQLKQYTISQEQINTTKDKK